MVDGPLLRRVMGGFATGVTVVTTCDPGGRPAGLTANAVTSVSLEPPLVLVCVDRRAECHPHFLATGRFVVNILAADQEPLSSRFARSGTDKFAGIAYETTPEGLPLLPDTLGRLDCRIVTTHEGGDHVIHVGQVERAEAREGEPLLFFRGRYARLP